MHPRSAAQVQQMIYANCPTSLGTAGKFDLMPQIVHSLAGDSNAAMFW